MKCSTHPNADATALCIHCGRALCPSCTMRSESGRVVCSTACSAALLQTEQALQSIRAKSVSSLRTTGYFVLAAGIVFGGFGVLEFFNGIESLAFFLLLLCAVFFAVGAVYLSIARKKEQPDDAL